MKAGTPGAVLCARWLRDAALPDGTYNAVDAPLAAALRAALTELAAETAAATPPADIPRVTGLLVEYIGPNYRPQIWMCCDAATGDPGTVVRYDNTEGTRGQLNDARDLPGFRYGRAAPAGLAGGFDPALWREVTVELVRP